MSAILVLGVTAFACTDDDNGDGNGTDEPTVAATQEATEAPTEAATEEATETPTEEATEEATATAAGTAEAGADELSAEVEDIAGGEITGTVNIREAADGGVEVEVMLEGVPEGAHANHIHEGSCEEMGAVVYPLDEAEADAEGVVEVTTTLEDATLEELSEGHYYQIHENSSEEGAGPGIACGNITAGGGE